MSLGTPLRQIRASRKILCPQSVLPEKQIARPGQTGNRFPGAVEQQFSPDRINDPVKDALFGMLSVFSQFERSLLKQRQKEGIAAAKAKGKHLGRPIKLTADQKDEIRKRSAAGEKPPELSKAFNVSRATIYNVIKG